MFQARVLTYNVTEGTVPSEEYVRVVQGASKQRVVFAGVRLAAVLEVALSAAAAAEAAAAAAAAQPPAVAGWGSLVVGMVLGLSIGGLLGWCIQQRRNVRQPRQKLRIYSPVTRRDESL